MSRPLPCIPGQRDKALVILRNANKRHPGNLDILSAPLLMSRESGDRPAALGYARELAGAAAG